MNFIKNFDQFGIPFQPTIAKQEKEYKSIFGGISSILLYTLSLAYFIYKVYLWQNGDILPRVSLQKSTQNYADVSFDYNPMMFQVVGMSGNSFIDPFSKTENIITPYFSYVEDITISEKQLMFDAFQPPARSGISTTVLPTNVTLVLNQNGITEKSPKAQKQLMILFQRCDDTVYENCASSEKQEAFFAQSLNTFFLTIQMLQFNTKLRQFEMISKQIYFILDKETVLYTQVLFQITSSLSDTGFVLESINESKFVSNFQTTSQQLPKSGFKKTFGSDFVGVFLIGIDSLSETQLIIYPKLGEILADVGSIMSTLMILKIIVIIVNSKLLEDTVLNKIISFYYPEITQLSFQKNILGQPKRVLKNGKEIEEKEQFLKYYDQLKQYALEKLTVTNQVYEISRLQFIVQSMQSRELIRQSHGLGIKLQFLKGNNIINQSFTLDCKEDPINLPKVFEKSAEKSRDEKNEKVPLRQQEQLLIPSTDILQDEDFMLLSIVHQKDQNKLQKTNDRSKFYEINNVNV